jgi:uncharacterized protein (TIGR02996 family)
MTTEEEFQRLLDDDPENWAARVMFADWLDDRGDLRGPGYRALAAQRRSPLQGYHEGTGAKTWWWFCPPVETELAVHNHLPSDWFALLPVGEGNQSFWPLHTEEGGVMTRRECEGAAALAFAQLPAKRRAELLAGQPELQS